jgi:hypothetical protein
MPAAPPAAPPPGATFDARFDRWTVSRLVDGEVATIESRLTHTVKVVDCGAARVDVVGKAKVVLVDRCAGTHVSLSAGCISTAELVNAEGVTLACGAVVPTVQVDKSSRCRVRLTAAAARGSQIVSADCEELVVLAEAPCGPGSAATDVDVEETAPAVAAAYTWLPVVPPSSDDVGDDGLLRPLPPGAQSRTPVVYTQREGGDGGGDFSGLDDDGRPLVEPALRTERFVLYERGLLRLGGAFA